MDARVEAGALGSEPGTGPATAGQIGLSVILPGAGHLLRGAWARGA